jgi:hypothetical protein
MIMPYFSVCTKTPEKIAEFQSTRIPPDAPTEGAEAKQSNLLGQNFQIARQSKLSHFVSCRQMISHSPSSILDLTCLCLLSALIPLTFQQSIRHFLLWNVLIIKQNNKDRR